MGVVCHVLLLGTLIMALKDLLKIFRWDYLSHYQWASWFATAGAIVVMAITFRLGMPMWKIAAIASAAAWITAALAGALGEHSDSQDTEHHEVSMRDFYASALGGLPVGLPLGVMAWILCRHS